MLSNTAPPQPIQSVGQHVPVVQAQHLLPPRGRLLLHPAWVGDGRQQDVAHLVDALDDVQVTAGLQVQPLGANARGDDGRGRAERFGRGLSDGAMPARCCPNLVPQ